MYRMVEVGIEVLLVHPGGPYFAKKDAGAWTIPKGEIEREDALACAKRELQEETGIVPSSSSYTALGAIKQAGGKTVHAWAFEGAWNGELVSTTFELEWPPRSGRKRAFPEVDRAAFFSIDEARRKMNPAQTVLIDRCSSCSRPSNTTASPRRRAGGSVSEHHLRLASMEALPVTCWRTLASSRRPWRAAAPSSRAGSVRGRATCPLASSAASPARSRHR